MPDTRERLIVGPDRVPCDDGTGSRLCLQVRRDEADPWELFYDQIEGFEPVEGTTYHLVVEVEEVDEPLADGSTLRYRLVEIERTS